MQEENEIPAIYISYAWNSESEAIAEAIEKEFQERGVRIIRDKNHLGYKGRIKDFMEQIGRGNYVILIISNKYLRSENCMFELLQIFKNQNFYERIFPLVLDEVNIAKAGDRIDLMKYWENETENLDTKIRELKDLSNIQGVTDDLNLYTEIRNNIARLTGILKDINTLNTDRHINSDFEQLYDVIQQKIKNDLSVSSNDHTDNGPISTHNDIEQNVAKRKKNKAIKQGVITILVALVLLLAFQGVKSYLTTDDIEFPKDSTAIATVKHDSLPISNEKAKIDANKKSESANVNSSSEVSNITYDVELVVPSVMANAAVFVDGRPAEILERDLVFIKIRVKRKNTSHHIELKDGTDSCFTDKLIIKDQIQVTLCD